MELTFLGSAQEVGRSCILLSSQDNIMMDCGVKIHSDSAYPMQPPANADYVAVTHAHLDHSGYLPALYKHKSPELLCTPPTLALTQIIVDDSLKIMAKRGEFPYHRAHVKKMVKNTTLLSYKKKYELNNSTFTFYNAGHIAGAGMCDIDTKEGRIVYTGDFKGEATKTTFATDPPPKGPKALITESTYSDTDHPKRKDLEIELKRQIQGTLEGGGTVLLPAFAIGRTQELMRIVRSIDKDVEIWVDGMGWRVSETLSHYSKYIKDFKQFRRDMKTCKPVTHRRYREKLAKKRCVIIATAGMLQGGPALGYLLRLGPESRAIFTGYCVENTNGYNLLNNGYVEYDGIKIRPKADYSYLDFSAHAGRKEMFDFAARLCPEKIFCVHGDKCPEFAEELKLEGFDAYAPKLGETVKI